MSKIVIKWNDKQVEKVLKLSLEDRMGVACLKLEGQAKLNISPSASGLHSRTGALAGSISSNWTGRRGDGSVSGMASMAGASVIADPGGRFPIIKGVVGSNLVYARIHELGGLAGRGRKVKIPMRPYLRPALAKGRTFIEKIFKDL